MIGATMKRAIGKMIDANKNFNSAAKSISENAWDSFFKNQILFQNQILSLNKSNIKVLPIDDVRWFEYHSLAMIEEIGEVLKADKRWKTHRNERYKKDEKLDELADVFITFLNLCIYSGFDAKDMQLAILKKIKENFERLQNE